MTFKNNKEYRQAVVQKECDDLIEDLEEQKHFRAEVQSKKVAWNAFPTSSIASINTHVDNTLRNYAYYNNKTGSAALNYFFRTAGKEAIEKIEKDYPQRPMYADWRAYRWHLHYNDLTKSQKKKDSIVKVNFNATYGRNKPCYDCSIWPNEKIGS